MADAPEIRSACEMLSGEREGILLLPPSIPHRLLQLAVKRGGLLDRHADALGMANSSFCATVYSRPCQR